MSKGFKGIWIPKEILAIEDIGTTEKMILSVILALDKNGGCKANNRYFAELLGISKTRVSLIIRNLFNKSYIGYISKVKGGIKENEKRVLNFTYTGCTTKVKDINRSIDNSTDSISYKVKQLENNFTMIQEVGKLLKTTPEAVSTLLNDFIQEQKAKGELGREISELRSHFVLWAKARNKPTTGTNGMRTHFPNGKEIKRDAQGKIKNVNDQYA